MFLPARAHIDEDEIYILQYFEYVLSKSKSVKFHWFQCYTISISEICCFSAI